jgi:hypothetical protein
MKTGRLLWQLTHWPGLLALCVVTPSFILLSGRGGPSRNDVLIALAAGMLIVGSRIMAIGGMRALRVLPDGHRMLVRALGALTLLSTLLFGGLAARAGVHHFVEPPTGNIALAFVAFSGLAFLVFVRELHGRAKIIALLAILGVTALTVLSMPRLVPAGPWLAAAAYGVLWLFALASRDVPRVPVTGAVDARETSAGWLARVRGGALRVRTPAAALLQPDREVLAHLPDALGWLVTWVITYHFIIGHRGPVDSYGLAATLAACAVAALLLAQSWGLPARARRLWLLSGAPRTGLLRLSERVLLVNLALLGTIAWLAASGFAIFRGLPIGAAEALLTLAGFAAGALVPIYCGLIMPTLARWWTRIPLGVFTGLSVVFYPALYIRRVIADAVDGQGFDAVTLLVILIATTAGLRAIAFQRWRRIDWTRVRFESTIRH